MLARVSPSDRLLTCTRPREQCILLSFTAICLICLLLERREARISLVAGQKAPISGRTLIHSAISDTLESFVNVECQSTRRQPFREASVGFLLHPRLERDPRRMRQGRIGKWYSGTGRLCESGGELAWAGRERHNGCIGRAGPERAGRRHQGAVAGGSSRNTASDQSGRPFPF